MSRTGNLRLLRDLFALAGSTANPPTLAGSGAVTVGANASADLTIETLQDQQHAVYLTPSVMVRGVNNVEVFVGSAFQDNTASPGALALMIGIFANLYYKTLTSPTRTEVHLYLNNNTSASRSVSYAIWRVLGLTIAQQQTGGVLP
jgi:hypothetical protein